MSERLLQIITDSFTKILLPGLTVTIPLTIISFTFAMIIAVALAMVQFAHIKVLKEIARFYIWIIPGHAASGSAVRYFLRTAELRDCVTTVPIRSDRLFYQ